MEKESEHILRCVFDKLNIDPKYRYSSVCQNDQLKTLFSKASKNNTKNRGIPDYVYYDGNTLIIFECKSHDLNKAESDVKHYITSLNYDGDESCAKHIYGCGFVNDTTYMITQYKNGTFSNVCNDTLESLLKSITLKRAGTGIDQETIQSKLHTIHNYIRDNTKISNEDKSLFIGGILVALCDQSFNNLIKCVSSPDISSAIIHILTNEQINIQNVENIYKNSLNNNHLLNITRLICEITQHNPSVDMLNEFYSEFVSYQNTDSKSLGIVLTPEHIVKLMIKLLNIRPDDVFLDLCSGTGSFLCEVFKYNPRKIVGCEYQKKLYDLLQINNILRGRAFKCIHDDCFVLQHQNINATKSAINPPYGMKDRTELDFILKQIELLQNDGLACAIFPTSCLTAKRYLKQRTILSSKCTILKIIKCNDKLFYPTAGVSTSIILCKKRTCGHNFDNDLVEFVDYSNDGIIIKKHIGKVKQDDFDVRFNQVVCDQTSIKCLISKDEEWKLTSYKPVVLTNKQLQLAELDRKYIMERTKIITDDAINTPFLYKHNKVVKVGDIFSIKICKRITLDTAKQKRGAYPYIAASKLNNGVVCYTNICTDDGGCLTIANSGSVGYTFYQDNKFCATDSIYVLRLKNSEYFESMTPEIGIYLSTILTGHFTTGEYNFGYALRHKRLQNAMIMI